jgi:hypothetical protein
MGLFLSQYWYLTAALYTRYGGVQENQKGETENRFGAKLL